jgi:hypothetical protein
MTKKAQAAFEFIVTYAWALLLILAAIAAFYMLDVGSYLQFQADECILFGQANCIEAQAVETGVTRSGFITTRIRNDFGTNLKLLNASVSDEYIDCDSLTFSVGVERDWNSSQIKNLTFVCGGSSGDFKRGSRTDSTITLTFFRETPYCNGNPATNSDCILTLKGKLALKIGRT